MIHTVVIQERARDDIDEILEWIGKRSPEGARRWLAELWTSIDDLAHEPDRFALAAEAARLGVSVRERLFRTRRGRNYRLLFLVDRLVVRVLRVRAPGQRPVETLDE